MILYESDVEGFIQAVRKNLLAKYMSSIFFKKYGRQITKEQQREWNYSLRCLSEVLKDSDIPLDCGIRLDYVLSQYSSHIEVIIAGTDRNSKQNIYILQLLSWQESAASEMEDMVRFSDRKGWQDAVHPGYQSASYKSYISKRAGAGDLEGIVFTSGVYLYDYVKSDPEPLLHSSYEHLLQDIGIYFSDDVVPLAENIREYVSNGKGKKLLNQLHIRDQFYAEGLEDYLEQLEKNKHSFSLNIEQKMAAASILHGLNRTDSKIISLIGGMPGTGKTVIAITLLNQLSKMKMKAAYVSPFKAQINYLNDIIPETEGIDFLTINQCINRLNHGLQYDLIICDEAQNFEGLNSQPMIENMINSSKVSAFLYSSSQRIMPGNRFELVDFLDRSSSRSGAKFYKFELNRNLRYSGQASGILWLTHQLQFDTNTNYEDWDIENFEIEVVDNPNRLMELTKLKSDLGNSARILANIADNSTRNSKDQGMYHLEEYQFSQPILSAYNGVSQKASVDYISSVYSVQGMEFDYVGVLIDDDLYFDEEHQKVCHGKKTEQPEEIIKNIYYVLVTRGKKGCFIFCRDKSLGTYLRDKVEYSKKKQLWVKYFVNLYAAQLEEKKGQELYDYLVSKRETISADEYQRLKEELEKAKGEAEKYKKYYLNAKNLMEKIGITPEVIENIKVLLEKIKDESKLIQEEDERAHFVQERTSTILSDIFNPLNNKLKVKQIENKISQAVGKEAWIKMSPKSQHFLISAEVMFESIESYNSLIDFSGVCLQVTKAFEFEMTNRYFTQYQDYLKTKYNEEYANRMPQSFYKVKRGNKVEITQNQYTLGNIPFTVGMFQDGRVIKNYERDHRMFLDYANDKLISNPQETNAILKKHLKEVHIITKKYRNEAAHKGSFDVIAAKECLDYMIDIQRILGKLLDDYNY
ncbi:DNA/RNA helicase domain-containing protein [Metabacillus fastidiosus]|uniref:DNA/RNA helicase domain-containing protein n=1 Tax=Metabacillus fastidiosus TaxID=1458 RepID=UPI003D2DDCAE